MQMCIVDIVSEAFIIRQYLHIRNCQITPFNVRTHTEMNMQTLVKQFGAWWWRPTDARKAVQTKMRRLTNLREKLASSRRRRVREIFIFEFKRGAFYAKIC